MASGVVFVDELDGENRIIGVERTGFLETSETDVLAESTKHCKTRSTERARIPSISALTERLGDDAEG